MTFPATPSRLSYRGFKRPAPSKYKNKRIECDGFTFDSQKEYRYYQNLKLLRERGEVLMFLMQVPFHLPGGVKYVLDFQIFWANKEISFVDVKGFKTEIYKLKKKQVEQLYPIVIEEA